MTAPILLSVLSKFPTSRLFQFFVDGTKHAKEQGEIGFEKREPGCMNAFYKAFKFILENRDQELTLDLIKKIHALASENVAGNFGILKSGHFRNNETQPFSISAERFTQAGMLSFMEATITAEIGTLRGRLKGGYFPDFDPKNDRVKELIKNPDLKLKVDFKPPFETAEDINKRANFLLNELKENLTKASKEEDKDQVIKAIVHFTRFMELLHPFGDGNGRVFVNLVLNLLLIQNNFLPVTLYEPNIFDLYSEDELVDAIKDAMSHTLFVIQHPEKALFNFKPPMKDNNECLAAIESVMAEAINVHSSQLQDEYISSLSAYLDSAWGGEFNLHRACAIGDLDRIKSYPKDVLMAKCQIKGPESIAPLYKGLSPLHIACKMNQPAVASYLISIDPTLINVKDIYGNSPLFYAIEAKNTELVNLLIKNGADLNIKNAKRASLLDWAAKCSNSTIFQIFLNNKYSLSFSEIPDYDQFDIVVLAAKYNNLELLKWLIQNQKINFSEWPNNPKLRCGRRDPLWSALNMKSSKDAFTLLLREMFPNKDMPFSIFEEYLYGIIAMSDYDLLETAISHTNLASKTELMKEHIFTESFFKKHRDQRLLLKVIELEKNIKDIVTVDGYSILSLAAANGLKDLCIKLVEMGCDPYHNNNGETPLSVAARNNKSEVITYFIETLNMDPNYTPPVSASNKGSPFLMYAGTKPKQPLSPLAIAIENGHLESVNLLLNLGAKVDDQAISALERCPKNREDIERVVKTPKLTY